MGYVSGVANTVNITPGGVAVKSVLKIRPQLGQPVQTLGVVEVDDEQTRARMDVRHSVKAIAPRMGRFQMSGTLKKIVNPKDHGPIVREATRQFPHAPNNPAAPLEAQIRIVVATEQKKNGLALRGEGDKVDPARRQRSVHGQDAGMAQK